MTVLLAVLLILEFSLRSWIEVRERRLTQLRGGVFALLRLVPLLNDIVPLPEKRRAPTESEFVLKHEEGHAKLHHSVLRNLVKVVLLLLAVWLFAFMLSSRSMSFAEAVLWLHLAAVPCRVVFNLYCWNQELEADRYAYDKLGKKNAKAAMRELADCEIPYTRLFAALYREHPPVSVRSYRILNKVIK